MKNADVSRTEKMPHVIFIFFGFSLVKKNVSSFIIVGYVKRILSRYGILKSHEQMRQSPSWIRLRINPFLLNFLFLHLLKTSENLWISNVFRGYKKGTFGKKCAMYFPFKQTMNLSMCRAKIETMLLSYMKMFMINISRKTVS